MISAHRTEAIVGRLFQGIWLDSIQLGASFYTPDGVPF